MLMAAALFVCWPLYRVERRLTPAIVLGAIVVLAASGGLYVQIGTPGAPSGPGATPSIEDMVAALDRRLRENPGDVEGWKMLGRSYVQLKTYDRAVAAFEEAVARENGADAQTLADLGEAILLAQQGSIAGRPVELFESALAVAPANPKALFYGGIAALERGNQSLAADRWEALLALSPPPEIRDILRARVAEWRGETPPARTLTVNVSLAAEAGLALGGDETVFIIARDPAQPSPPIAVARRKANELPATITLTDADAMIPGRLLSQFDRLEVIARASLSGEPVAQAGDWYASADVDFTQTGDVSLAIGQRVE